MARMTCLFSMMFGLSAWLTLIASDWNSWAAARNSLSTYSLSIWASFWHDSQPCDCQSFYILVQSSKRECSKRQKMEDASLLRSRSFNSGTCATYFQSKQSQSLSRLKGRYINPTSWWEKYQSMCGHLQSTILLYPQIPKQYLAESSLKMSEWMSDLVVVMLKCSSHIW